MDKAFKDKLWYIIRSELSTDKNESDISEIVINSKSDEIDIDIHLVHDKSSELVYIYTIGLSDTDIRVDGNPVELYLIASINTLKIKELIELNNISEYPWLIYTIMDICVSMLYQKDKDNLKVRLMPISNKYNCKTNYRCVAVANLIEGRVFRQVDNIDIELLPLIFLKSQEMKECNNTLNEMIQIDAILQLYGNITYADRDVADKKFSRPIIELLSTYTD